MSERIAEIAHDLKTPLAMIVGYAELLQARDDAAIRAEAPARILEAAERLTVALDALLAELTDRAGLPR